MENNYKKNNEIILLQTLKKAKQPLSAKNLSEIVGCSDRSIRNYVKEVNSFKNIIYSSTKGYYLSTLEIDDIIIYFSNIHSGEKEIYIVNELLNSYDGISLYSLQEKLFISSRSIDTYISNINKRIATYNLQIKKKKEHLYLIGSEKDKRNLFKSNLRVNDYSLIENELRLVYQKINISYDKVKNIIIDSLKTHSLYVNDYSLLNILTHISVKLARLTLNYQSAENINLDRVKYKKEIECSESVFNQFNKLFAISFNQSEIDQLSLLFISKSNSNFHTNTEDIDFFVNFVKDIINDINKKYAIDLYDIEFIDFFSLHIKNLIKRCSFESFNKNPLFEQVINLNPFVYEIACFIASKINEILNYDIPKDEIAFLAFHIGSIVVKKNILKEDIYIAIEDFDFYHYSNTILNRLENTFPNYIHFDLISSNSLVSDSFTYDLLINTSSNSNISINFNNSISISPLITDYEINLIKQEIEKIKIQKKNLKIQYYFEQFFNPNLFEKNVYLNNETEYIEYISNKFVNYNICTDSFKNSVLEREAITSTSFDNRVALPHSLNESTIKNCAYVIINDKPIKWGPYEVNIIMLIGINENHQKDFKFLYENLINKLNNPKIIERLIKQSSYSSFIDILTSEEK